MSKPKVARLRRPTPDKAPRPSTGPTKTSDSESDSEVEFSSDLETALSKARAAAVLLRTDSLDMPPGLTVDEQQEIGDWINGFAMDALEEALKEAEAAREKYLGPSVFGKRKAVA
ncbi:MAG: hypothetical protein Q7W02_00120 [Candidatus Rokubacteria bacterium]|nr:hypothetical protein [Candidatus Rokubacteria bacterium]